jgi:transglutaminase-like putative cysteine protease
MNRLLAERRTAAPVIMLLAGIAAVVAVVGLYGLFETWSLLVPAAAGAAAAVVVGIVAHRYSLLLGESIAASLLALAAVGSVVCGPQGFFGGLVGSWSEIVSVTQPADLTADLRVVPLALAWLGATAGCELIRWTRTPALFGVGPLVALVLAVLLGAESRTIAITQGALLGLLALVGGVVQQRLVHLEREISTAAHIGHRRTNLVRVSAMLGIVAVIAPLAGPRLPLAEARDRVELRQRTVPPWNPLSVPSPLVQVKASLDEQRRDQAVFTVRAAQPIDRWPIAVLGDFDGQVWTVGSGDTTSAADEFRAIDTRLPKPDQAVQQRPTVSAQVTMVGGQSPWLPVPGVATAIELADDADTDTGTSAPLRANLRTGTLALPGGVPAGLTYQVTAHVPAVVDDAALTNADIRITDASDEFDALPPSVRNLTADLLEGQGFGWRQVETVRDTFTRTGFYDATERAAPGHSWYRLETFLEDQGALVGFEEQYAAAAAVILRTAQLPTRVVVGYRVPQDRWSGGAADVLAGDISAWVEVAVDGYGWVPVDVTPPRTRTPDDQQQGTIFEDIAVPNPPPPPQPPPKVDVVVEDEEEDEDDENSDDEEMVAGGWSTTTRIVAASSASVLLLVLAAAAVIWLKQRRRQRRRTMAQPAARVAGAWFELADRYAEARLPLEQRRTPHETVRAVLAQPVQHDRVPGDADEMARRDLRALANAVDRAAYHSRPPDDGDAERAWQYCDRVVDALHAQHSRAARLRMKVDPRTLGRRDPVPEQSR